MRPVLVLSFLIGVVLQAAPIPVPFTRCTITTLHDATLEDLTKGLETCCFTSVDLVKTYISRIDEVNLKLRAVHEINPDAARIATALDAERAAGTIRGPLHGVPILLKDNIATFDKMNNTAGSYALVGARVPRDSTVAAKLRAAGAIILGKTTMSEFAQFRSSNGTSGWSPLSGQSYGPYCPNQDPYGSSSGSGIAAALGLSFATLGTETHGSIVQPAQRANCVGIKPSVGLTSRYLVIPISKNQDTVGPIAHTVRDAAAVLDAIAGVDPRDNYTNSIPSNGKVPNYVAATTFGIDLRGFRIGVPRNGISSLDTFAPSNQTHIMSEFDKAIQVLRSLGAEILDNANFSAAAREEFIGSSAAQMDGDTDKPPNNELLTLGADFISDMAAYLAELTHNPFNLSTVLDIRKFTASHPSSAFPDRDMEAWDSALDRGFNSSDVRAWNALQANLRLDAEGGVTGVMNHFNLSAMILPTDFAPAWTAAPGLPEVTVPMGAYPLGTPVIMGAGDMVAVAPGIPFGLTFFGKKWTETTLIRLAYAYEQATKHRDAVPLGKGSTKPTAELSVGSQDKESLMINSWRSYNSFTF